MCCFLFVTCSASLSQALKIVFGFDSPCRGLCVISCVLILDLFLLSVLVSALDLPVDGSLVIVVVFGGIGSHCLPGSISVVLVFMVWFFR